MASIRQTWRNPLARTADRAEATARLLLTTLWLLTLPVIAVVGSLAWQQASAIAEDQRHTRSSTTAQLLDDAPDIAIDDQGMFIDQQQRATARWIAPDGSERIGSVTTTAGGHTGDRIKIWVDRTGAVTSPPASPTTSAVLIITLATGVALAWARCWLWPSTGSAGGSIAVGWQAATTSGSGSDRCGPDGPAAATATQRTVRTEKTPPATRPTGPAGSAAGAR